MIWVFARVIGDFRPELSFLREHGITESILADPDGRISQNLASELLRRAAQRIGDPALGLHAGEMTEAADWGTLHYMGRNCVDFRSMLECGARFIRLVDDLAEADVLEQGGRGIWKLSYRIPRTPLVNDFQAAAVLRTFARALGRDEPPLEVHLAHAEATDAREYERVFRAPLRLGAEHNAIVFPRSLFDSPLVGANPELLEPFERQAQKMLESIARSETTAAKTQRLILERLGGNGASMNAVAHGLHMSPATLRRRLVEENTTFQDLLDGIRRELALRHIENPRLAVGEIAGLLGFSSLSAFGRAFRRWSGTSAAEYRAEARLRASRGAANLATRTRALRPISG